MPLVKVLYFGTPANIAILALKLDYLYRQPPPVTVKKRKKDVRRGHPEYLKCSPPRTPLGELTALPQIPWLVGRGLAAPSPRIPPPPPPSALRASFPPPVSKS